MRQARIAKGRTGGKRLAIQVQGRDVNGINNYMSYARHDKPKNIIKQPFYTFVVLPNRIDSANK